MIGSLPDLLSSYRLQRDHGGARLRLETAGQELASGRKADLTAAAGGDLRRLYAIEAALVRARAEADRISFAEGRAEATQAALGQLADLAETNGVALLAAVERGDALAARGHAGAARAAFAAAVAALNGRHAGRSLFAGAATDQAALAPADQILDEVAAAIAGAPDAAAAIAAIDAYFNDPAGGFASSAFQGAALDAAEADLGGSRLAFAERADSDAVRRLLQGLATIVMGHEEALGASAPAASLFFATGASDLLAARDALGERRAGLGMHQETIERAATRQAAGLAALELAQTRLLERDTYDAAAAFGALETQMQSIYTVTARLSGLSLAHFLG